MTAYWEQLLPDLEPLSPPAESYRILSCNIRAATTEAQIRTLVMTSACQGEGKTVTLANLGVALAQAGIDVLMLDANFRSPMLHHCFRTDNLRGLSSVLNGKVNLREAILETSVINLRLLPAGPQPSNPAELLCSRGIAAILEESKALAEITLIDTPHLIGLADALTLSTQADGTLLVIKLGQTNKAMLSKALAQLERAKAKLLGMVSTNTIA